MIGRKLVHSTWCCAALAAAALLPSCGGGGGGGPGSGPAVLIGASFSGAGANPVAGDALLLSFSKDVQIRAGTLLTDADFTVSGGGSLGAVASAPTQLTARVVSIVLGAGVNLVAGATTLSMATANDSIADSGNVLATAGTPVVLGTSDGVAPTLSNLTLNGIPDALNGDGAAGGTLQVPANGFTIDVTFFDASGVDVSRTVISASVAVATTAGSQPPGTNLVPFLTVAASSATTASFLVPAATTFPNATIVLSAAVVDNSGLSSTALTFDCIVQAHTSSSLLFETTVNASQVWFLDLSRDIESFTVNLANVASPVEVDQPQAANGIADLDDLFVVLGLMNTGSTATNTAVRDRFGAGLVDRLEQLYADTNVTFTLTRPPGPVPTNTPLVPYSSGPYSQISIAGSSTLAGVLGIAVYDEFNDFQDDNSDLFFGDRLGVFLHTIVDQGFTEPGVSPFRQTYDPFTPVRGGTPIGADASDGLRLAGTLNDARATLLRDAIDDMAVFAAVVTAHEIGHSLGLVKDLAMPVGLYGNDTTNFPGSSPGHIRNSALFPSGSTNVMSPSLGWSSALHASTDFNTLNKEYLRERVLYDR